MDELQVVEETNLMLTTIDNPYNPKTHYDVWKRWDVDNGYNTEEFIARLISMEDEVYNIDDEIQMSSLTNKVIMEILEQDVLGIYMLV